MTEDEYQQTQEVTVRLTELSCGHNVVETVVDGVSDEPACDICPIMEGDISDEKPYQYGPSKNWNPSHVHGGEQPEWLDIKRKNGVIVSRTVDL